MAWSLPRALRRLGADLCHTQYALPLRAPCPCVVTVHDLSFERDPGLMSRKDRLVFRRIVPASVRKAKRVFTVSERTKADLVELYGAPPEKIVVTPNGVDPIFRRPPGEEPQVTTCYKAYVLTRRGRPAAEEPARCARGSCRCWPSARRRRAGEGSGACRGAPAAGERASRGTSRRIASPSSIAAPSVSCSRRGTRASGSRCSRQWHQARRSSPCPIPRCGRWPETRRSSWRRISSRTGYAGRSRSATALAAAGLERAQAFSWRAAAERTLAVYREILDA